MTGKLAVVRARPRQRDSVERWWKTRGLRLHAPENVGSGSPPVDPPLIQKRARRCCEPPGEHGARRVRQGWRQPKRRAQGRPGAAGGRSLSTGPAQRGSAAARGRSGEAGSSPVRTSAGTAAVAWPATCEWWPPTLEPMSGPRRNKVREVSPGGRREGRRRGTNRNASVENKALGWGATPGSG